MSKNEVENVKEDGVWIVAEVTAVDNFLLVLNVWIDIAMYVFVITQ